MNAASQLTRGKKPRARSSTACFDCSAPGTSDDDVVPTRVFFDVARPGPHHEDVVVCPSGQSKRVPPVASLRTTKVRSSSYLPCGT